MDKIMKDHFQKTLLQTPRRMMNENGQIIEVYDQPERSKREDFEKLADEFLESPCSDRGGNWETENGYFLGIEEYSKWLNQRCGALNTMETS